jgi:hypothetical protein
MKKRIIYSAIILLAGVGFSCEPDKVTENVSQITYFPEFDYQGEEQYLIGCGTPFQDPGVSATENGEQITVSKRVTSMLGSGASPEVGTAPDRYNIQYSAVNQDGFSATATREVWVACAGDLTTSLEGLYTATVSRNGGAPGAQYSDMQYILIKKVAENVYEISDASGGYYSLGRAYGDAYNSRGLRITVKDMATNTFSFNGPVGLGAFGGILTMKSLEVDAASKTINFVSSWDTADGTNTIYDFAVTLKQVATN